MQCLILAGGLGTRMEQVSNGLPKSLIPVLGKPFIDYQLTWLAEQGITRIILSIGYQARMIADFVGSGDRWGLEIICIEDGLEPLGTAGAIRKAVDHDILKGGFFVLYGDSYLKADFHDIWQTSGNGNQAVMTVYKNDGDWDSCNVILNNGELVLFQKDAPPEIKATMRHIDYGLSVLNTDLIIEMIPSDKACDMAVIQNQLSLEGRLAAYEVFDRFYEIGSPQGLADLESHLKNESAVR